VKTILRPSGEQNFLKDAIRDLVVVVVGILAALYLESWWQDRQDRAEEASLLDGLRTEFVANKTQLAEMMAVWDEIAVAAGSAAQYMGQSANRLDSAKVVPMLRDANVMRFFDPRTGQLSSLINSGKLGLIQNVELRAGIADWPSLVDDLEVEREIALKRITIGYRYRLNQYLSQEPGAPFENRIADLLEDRDIYGDLLGIAANMRRSVREGQAISRATDDIIAMIDVELGDSR